jgi:hypothetical protein
VPGAAEHSRTPARSVAIWRSPRPSTLPAKGQARLGAAYPTRDRRSAMQARLLRTQRGIDLLILRLGNQPSAVCPRRLADSRVQVAARVVVVRAPCVSGARSWEPPVADALYAFARDASSDERISCMKNTSCTFAGADDDRPSFPGKSISREDRIRSSVLSSRSIGWRPNATRKRFGPGSCPKFCVRLRKMVGVAGFEPATPSSRTRCATSGSPDRGLPGNPVLSGLPTLTLGVRRKPCQRS